MTLQQAYADICQKAESDTSVQFLSEKQIQNSKGFEDFLKQECATQTEEIRRRLLKEFLGLGPIEDLLADESITEILVNSPTSIWFERSGQLYPHLDHFLSKNSFENIVDRLTQKTQQHLTLEKPFVEGHYLDTRLSVVGSSITPGSSAFSIRKHPPMPWSLQALQKAGWCQDEDILLLKQLVASGTNFLVIGETGSGKTSILNALLQETKDNERCLVIEDSSEIRLPNAASLKLLTRTGVTGQYPSVDQQQLLKRALRLRPDRLIMGEIRGEESKDFLMMLATGHQGSMATLHAKNPQEALLRLEMLIQLGAPQWNLTAIRRLIFLSLQMIVLTERTSTGQRRLKNIYRLSSLEDSGLTFDSVDRFTLSTTSSDIV